MLEISRKVYEFSAGNRNYKKEPNWNFRTKIYVSDI